MKKVYLINLKLTQKTKLKSTPLQGLMPFSNLDDEHPAKQYF